MIDRLKELKNIGSSEQSSSSADSKKGKKKEKKTKTAEKSEKKSFLQEFVDSFEDFRGFVEEIKSLGKDIKGLEEQSIEERKPYKEIYEEMNEKMTSSRKTAGKASELIQLGKKRIEEREKQFKESKTEGNAELTMMKNILSSNLTEFQSAMKDFQSSSESFREALRSKIKRRALVVQKDLNEEELEALVDSPDPQAFLRKKLLAVHGDVLQRVEEIEEQHASVKRIEKNVLQIHEMFKDLACLVEAQNEKLDAIERNVLQTKEHLVKANEELVKAEKQQTEALSCCSCCSPF